MREGWRETTLEAVAQTVRPNGIDDSGSSRYVGLEHFDPSVPRIVRWGSTAEVTSVTTPFRPGDVLFSKLRPYLRKVAVADFAGRCTTEALVYRPSDDSVSAAYLGVLLQSERALAHAQASSAGSRMPRTSVKLMASLQFALPPLVEQHRIVDLIGAIDNVIVKAEVSEAAARTSEREARRTAFLELAGDLAPAGQMFEMTLGKQKTAAGLDGRLDMRYLRAANIGDGRLNLQDVGVMSFAERDVEAFSLRRGDVVLVEGGSVGLAAVWQEQIAGPVGFDKHVIRVRPRDGRSSTDFALHWARWSRESGAFDAQATGITIKALGYARASAMAVPDIGIDVQNELTAPLVALDTVATAHRASAARLRDLRAKMLTALLSGEHAIPATYDDLMEVAA